MLTGLERLKMRADSGIRWRWLSGRMQDIVVLVGSGMTYEEIGTHLGIKEKTVTEYARRIRDRLGEDGRPRDVIMRHFLEETG